MSFDAEITGRDPSTGEAIRLRIKDRVIADLATSSQDTDTFLAPGLVDLQVNGYSGLDLNDGRLTQETLVALCRSLSGIGVTTFLPTLITASEDQIIDTLATISKTCRSDRLAGEMIVGVHVEGPSVSAEDGPRGAHPVDHVRSPSVAEFARWQAACDGLVTMVTIAPEHVGALDYIEALSAQGVHVSIGHSAASADQIHAAVRAGARFSTHLGNGAAAQLPRHPNLIWAQLADIDLTASFITDGHHLPADTFVAMLRAKGLERSMLVSDTVALAGLPPGVYDQPVGGKVQLGEDGRVSLAGTPYLAGAGLPLIASLPIAMRMAGLDLGTALRLATVNPGRHVGRGDGLKVGARADIMRFKLSDTPHGPFEIQDVWSAGQRIVP